MPDETWAAVQGVRRVIAVGTSVVRALESAARGGGVREGLTDLVLGPETELRVVHGLLSGMHEPGESHFRLMGAFLAPAHLRAACTWAAGQGFRSHEFGDSTLVF